VLKKNVMLRSESRFSPQHADLLIRFNIWNT